MQHDEHPQEWYEREYNPRLTIPDMADIVAAWVERSAALRANRPVLADIQTGDHPRERVDLFRASPSKGTVVYLHGGFWCGSSKEEVSWVAESLLSEGYSVALLNYPLCPEVSLETLVESVRRSFARLISEVLNDAERRTVVVAGHSAGGYLAADLVATDWTAYGLPPQPFTGAVLISGMFDLGPLVCLTRNEFVGLTAELAARLSLHETAPKVRVPLAFVVGGAETSEFRRQSRTMAKAWSELEPDVVEIPGANHFTVVEDLSLPASKLRAVLVGMLARGEKGAVPGNG